MLSKIKKLIARHGLYKTVLILAAKITYRLCALIIIPVIHFTITTRNNRLVFTGSSKANLWQSDNGAILTNYLIKKRHAVYDIIWLVKDPHTFVNRFLSEDIKLIRSHGKHHGYVTFKAYCCLKSANIVFSTHFLFRIRKKNGRPISVNLWHGCGYKDTTDKQMANTFDYFIVPGQLFIEPKAKAYCCDRSKILALGYPRYDLFNKDNEEAINYIKRFKKSQCEKVIIWMPTIRKTNDYEFPENTIKYTFELPILNSVGDLRVLDNYCSSQHVKIIIKRHKAQVEFKSKNIATDNIIFIDDEELTDNGIELYEILKYTDAMLTDYSSAAIDYLLIDKPIGYTLDDFDQYKTTRGFIFDDPREYMPGNQIYNLNDLRAFIYEIANNIDNNYIKRKKIREIAHIDLTNYSKNIADYFDL